MTEETQEYRGGGEDNSAAGDGEERQQQAVDMGSATIHTQDGTIHTLTIVGQIEGHQEAPQGAKTTKYEHVLPLLTANPARLVGLSYRKGSIAPGKDADLVVLDEELNVKETYVAGRCVYAGECE